MSQTGLYSQVVGVVGVSGPATGLGSICNSAKWPAEGGLLLAAAKGLFESLFENHSSGFSPHLEDVGSSWHWVVDAIDSEDNRGQVIDCKI